jgi:hypothetical protein
VVVESRGPVTTREWIAQAGLTVETEDLIPKKDDG